jgi:hypothetical protein
LEDLIGKFEIPLCETFLGETDHFVNIMFFMPDGCDLRVVESSRISIEKRLFGLL